MISEACPHGLLIDRTKYKEMFTRCPTPPFICHDELEQRFWRFVELLPRWELENDPPPPRRLFRWGPTGRRLIGKSAREGVVLIDSHAREFYSTRTPPWSDGRTNGKAKFEAKFVKTAARSASCECLESLGQAAHAEIGGP
jgi:hypothetical protein